MIDFDNVNFCLTGLCIDCLLVKNIRQIIQPSDEITSVALQRPIEYYSEKSIAMVKKNLILIFETLQNAIGLIEFCILNSDSLKLVYKTHENVVIF